MKRLFITFITFILAVCFSKAYAETYTWTDEQGTMHFTEDLGAVPAKIRNKVRKEEAVSDQEETLSPLEVSTKAPLQTPSLGGDGGNAQSGAFAGKTNDQWQQELVEREAAMTAVRKQTDEIAAMLSKSANKMNEQKKLLQEHRSLSAQFKEMKAEYNQRVEIARKAGLKIDIQQ